MAKAIVINYGTLRSELLTDPGALGYSGLVDIGNDQGCADILNLARSTSGYSVFRNDISPSEIINSISSGDFLNMTQINVSRLNLFFVQPPIDATLTTVRANIRNIFSGMTTTLTSLSGVASRDGSRAEVLFGTGCVVTNGDVATALRHTSG